MAFSGALTLTDLNDFIAPSQACIKPVEQANPQKDLREAGAATTEIRIDTSGSYYEVSAEGPKVNGAGKKLEQAQISLNDCLACSGCITSAESVLVSLQSHTEVLNFLGSNPGVLSPSHKTTVLSVSPQSLASLATWLSSKWARRVSVREVLVRIRGYAMEQLGIEYVYDTTFARHVGLLEHGREFAERKGRGELPMLASACPGWICYAEKTHPEVLGFISRTKSPQQVMGTLVKSWMGRRWGKSAHDIYHVTVMPCYDKKLEASRQGAGERDVDCVITTGELVQMMPNMPDMPDVPDAVGGGCRADIPDLVHHPGTSSGSYLHSVISTIASSSASPLDLSVRAVRSSDSEEYVLEDRQTGQVVFRGAKCYGFRNIQNLVRKLRRGKAGYDYVEVMACPGGCVNGGGQLKPPDKAWSTSVENAYWHDLSTHTPDVLASQMLVDLCQPTAHATGPKTWATCMDADAEARRTRLFRTEYQAVDSQVSGLAINW